MLRKMTPKVKELLGLSGVAFAAHVMLGLVGNLWFPKSGPFVVTVGSAWFIFGAMALVLFFGAIVNYFEIEG